MKPVHFSPEAREDLGAALLFLKKRRPRAALRLLAEIDAAINLLAGETVDGPEVTLTTGERLLRWVVTPYVIYYERRAGALWVNRIYHGRREPLAR